MLLTFDPDGMTLSHREVTAGPVRLTLTSPDLDVGSAIMFRLRGSATLEDLRLDWQQVFSDDAAVVARATRDLSRHAVFAGLAEVTKGRTVSVTQLLTAGDYYIQDSQFAVAGTRHVLRLRVSGPAGGQAAAPTAHPTIAFTAGNRLDVTGALPATGTVTLHNRSGSIQSLNVWPVRDGTTDAALQAWLDAGAEGDPGFFLDGPTTGFVLMSPGRTAQLTWDLPPGTYVLFDEVPDDHTGVPRVFEGMHRVVVLSYGGRPGSASADPGRYPHVQRRLTRVRMHRRAEARAALVAAIGILALLCWLAVAPRVALAAYDGGWPAAAALVPCLAVSVLLCARLPGAAVTRVVTVFTLGTAVGLLDESIGLWPYVTSRAPVPEHVDGPLGDLAGALWVTTLPLLPILLVVFPDGIPASRWWRAVLVTQLGALAVAVPVLVDQGDGQVSGPLLHGGDGRRGGDPGLGPAPGGVPGASVVALAGRPAH